MRKELCLFVCLSVRLLRFYHHTALEQIWECNQMKFAIEIDGTLEMDILAMLLFIPVPILIPDYTGNKL